MQPNTDSLFHKFSISVFIGALIGIGLYGIQKNAPDIYRLYSSDLKPRSVPELRDERKTMETQVRGEFDYRLVLDETSEFVTPLKIKRNIRRFDPAENKPAAAAENEKGFHYYYYALTDKDRKACILVYSSIKPPDFIKQYGSRPVTLRGVWEEMPDVQVAVLYGVDNRNDKHRDMPKEKLEPGRSEYLRSRWPEGILLDRRLNLNVDRSKFDVNWMFWFHLVILLAGLYKLRAVIRKWEG